MDTGYTNNGGKTPDVFASGTLRQQTLSYVCHLVIPGKNGDRVIGEEMTSGLLRLPRIELPTGFDWSQPGKEDEVETYMEAQLGIRGYIARCVWNGCHRWVYAVDGIAEHKRVLVEPLDDGAALQKPLRWIHRDVACKSEWVRTNGDEEDGHLNRQLEAMLTDINCKTSRECFEAWETIGWFTKVTSWTRDVLESRKMVMEGRLRQRYRSGYSSVMWCEVKMQKDAEANCPGCSEVVFMKASVPRIREAQRTVAIWKVLGNVVPEVIGFHGEAGLMIQRNGGNVTDDPWDQEGLINSIVNMQLLSMNRISELEAGGLLVADSNWVESNVESILNHEVLDVYYRSGPDEAVDEAKKSSVDMLRSKVGAIQKVCREITSLGLPRTLVHGDMYLLNVGSRLKEEGNMYQMFDWARSFIGNPLHDFVDLLRDVTEDFPGYSIDFEAGVRQVCKHWKPCATLEEMKSVFALVGTLSNLIWLYDLTQQHDTCDDSQDCRQADVLLQMSCLMEYLVNVVGDADARNPSDEQGQYGGC